LQTNPHYQNEIGITPEEHIIYAIKHLEQTNHVIDDWQGKGSNSYQLGAYLSTSGSVPNAHWSRDYRQAVLDEYDPWHLYPDIGVRAVVRV